MRSWRPRIKAASSWKAGTRGSRAGSVAAGWAGPAVGGSAVARRRASVARAQACGGPEVRVSRARPPEKVGWVAYQRKESVGPSAARYVVVVASGLRRWSSAVAALTIARQKEAGSSAKANEAAARAMPGVRS